ncbi:MAG TPA: hypothetical protein VFM94_08945 [Solirubrobacterales bacterium]|nr:hypothetical protein [Solirubrobacterales bacterium]
MKVLVAAIGVVGCLGAVAYAAAPRGPDGGAERRSAPAQLPRPTITMHPNRTAVSTNARFGFTTSRRVPRFQCRLDRRGWRTCQAPIVFTNLDPGQHRFSVRALSRRGQPGPAARFHWRLLEPKDFSIEPQLEGIGSLYPGARPLALPIKIVNPNPVPIRVTSLRVAAAGDPQGCHSDANLEPIPASVSSAAPVKIPAGGSLNLPAPGVSPPAIRLRDLPVNQDACQGARFPLAFSGKARG